MIPASIITTLKLYPAYKESSLPWLGKVPGHWEVGTLRRYLRPIDGIKIGPFGSQLKLDQMSQSGYKVYGQANVIAKDFVLGSKFVDQEKYKELCSCEVRPGDLLVTMMGTSGRCASAPASTSPGIMDSHLLRLRTSANLDVRFTALVIDKSSYVKEQFTVIGKGSIMQGLNSSMVKNIVLALPPLPEQAAIVRYLDLADRKVRHAIRARRQLIKLLTEQKQAIINRAVTRGLDPNVRLKASGIPWLGDVPEHWEVRRLKQVCTRSALYGANIPASAYSKNGIRFLRTTDIRDDGSLKLGGVHISPESAAGYVLENGDLLISRSGTIGRSFVYDSARHGPCAYAGYLVRFVLGASVVPTYLMYYTKTPAFADFLKLVSIQSTIENVNGEKYANSILPLPSPSEQSAIVRYLDDAMANLDKAIDAAQREIDLLREYRTRLIADVVTGKLDVRDAAASLPDEPEEQPEPLDEEPTDGAPDAEPEEEDNAEQAEG